MNLFEESNKKKKMYGNYLSKIENENILKNRKLIRKSAMKMREEIKI